jgi:transposase
MKCPRCKGACSKAGFINKVQRHKCKICGYQFTRNQEQWGFPKKTKYLALYLYLNKMSIRSIAKTVGASAPAVLSWIKEMGESLPTTNKKRYVEAVEVDEMWHYLETKKKNFGFSKQLIALQESGLPVFVVIVQ